jgi:hypothetical protein
MRDIGFKEGTAVQVMFWDHAQNGSGILLCTVWGKIVRVTRQAYTIRTWETEDEPDDSDLNQHDFHIVRSAIRDVKKLVPGGAR